MQICQFIYKLLLKSILRALVIICTSHQLIFSRYLRTWLSVTLLSALFLCRIRWRFGICRRMCVLFHPLPHLRGIRVMFVWQAWAVNLMPSTAFLAVHHPTCLNCLTGISVIAGSLCHISPLLAGDAMDVRAEWALTCLDNTVKKPSGLLAGEAERGTEQELRSG